MTTPAAARPAVVLFLPIWWLAACSAPATPAAGSANAAESVPVTAAVPVPKPATPAAGPGIPKRGTTQPADTTMANTDDTAFEVELRRRGCFGRCPSYRLNLSGDGRVQFVGERHVSALGLHEAQVSAAVIAALRAELQREPFAALDGRYTPEDPRCGPAATDMASVSIVIRDGNRSREIQHYLGCSRAPASLRALATAIDEAGGSRRWIEAPTE